MDDDSPNFEFIQKFNLTGKIGDVKALAKSNPTFSLGRA